MLVLSFTFYFYFGFRRSEILGLRKTDINLLQNYFFVQGMFDVEDNTYRNKTKNEGSKEKFILILLVMLKKRLLGCYIGQKSNFLDLII